MKAAVLAVAAVVAGCTDDPAASADLGRSSVLTLGGILTTIAAKNPLDTLENLSTFAADAQQIIPMHGQRVEATLLIAGCDQIIESCSSAACMYSGSCSGLDSSLDLNGAVIHSQDRLDIDVKSSQLGAGEESTIEIDGSLVITADRLAGSVEVVGEARTLASADFDVTLDYRAVALDAQGCPIGGSMVVTSHYVPTNLTPAPGFAAARDATATLHFNGAACR